MHRILLVSILVAVTLFPLLTSCSAEKPQAVRMGLASMPLNLDPRFSTDAASGRVERLIYQKLVDFDEAKMPIPVIADWVQVSPLHYRFILNNKRNKFHNGDTLTSKDVKATYDFILNKDNASPHRTSLALIEKVETPDTQTIDFFLTRNDPLFPAYLVIGIVPHQLIDQDHKFNKQPIGSGPFQFITKTDEGKLQIKRIADNLVVEFLHVPNPTVRVLKLQRGEVDIIQNDLPPELVTYLSELETVNIQRTVGSKFQYIGFNMEDPVLKHVEIRRAIAFAIDRDEIINFVFGHSARETQSLFPADHWAGNPALKGYEYNPEKAKALLAEFGYTIEKPLELTYKTSNNPFRIRIATIYQHQLKNVGINLDIRSYDWGTFYGDIKSGRFQLYSLAWVGIKTPDIFRYTMHSGAIPPNGANRGRYINHDVDKMIEEAESYKDLNKQAEVYRKLQNQLLKDLPYIPLWFEDNVVITRKRVHHYTITSEGNFDGLKTVTL